MKVAELVVLLAGQFEEVFVLLAVDCRGNSGRPDTCRGLCTIFLDLQFRVASGRRARRLVTRRSRSSRPRNPGCFVCKGWTLEPLQAKKCVNVLLQYLVYSLEVSTIACRDTDAQKVRTV